MRGLCRGTLGSRPGHRQDSCFLGILSATSRFPQELGLPEGLASFLRQICCGKSLELGLGKERICLQTCARGEMCVGGGGLCFRPRSCAVSLRPGAGGRPGRVPRGTRGKNHSCSLPPSSAGEPLPRWHVGLAVLPTRGAPPAPVRSAPSAVSSLTESLMGTSLLSTVLGSGGLGWRRGGCTPRVARLCGGLQNQPEVSGSGNREICPPPQASAACCPCPWPPGAADAGNGEKRLPLWAEGHAGNTATCSFPSMQVERQGRLICD